MPNESLEKLIHAGSTEQNSQVEANNGQTSKTESMETEQSRESDKPDEGKTKNFIFDWTLVFLVKGWLLHSSSD